MNLSEIIIEQVYNAIDEASNQEKVELIQIHEEVPKPEPKKLYYI